MDDLVRQINDLQDRLEVLETHGSYVWVYPTDTAWAGTAGTPLTSTSWDGDARSTTAKTLIDLSAVFGVPAGVHAVLVRVNVNDSASAAGDYYLILGWNNTSAVGEVFNCPRSGNDHIGRYTVVVPCDANGDVYFQVVASGASTLDVTLQVHGYEL